MAASFPPPRVLFRDAHFVAVEKPTGLLVHRTAQDAAEPDALLQRVRDLLGMHLYPVHRLDKPTSGIVVFALNPSAAATLSGLFAQHLVEKTYEAVVRGWMETEGLIDHPLSRPADARSPGPRLEAQTRFRTLARYEVPESVSRYDTARSSLVCLSPMTGRTHQLRRHLKHVFHPIIGDRKYGDDAHNRFFARRFASDRLLLAAVALSFEHPFEPTRVEIACRPDASFECVVRALSGFASG